MFGMRLTQLRKQRGLTQNDVAKILGIARTTYSSYEQGRRSPDVEIQNKIADYFNVSLDYLHGREKTEDYTLTEKQLRVASHIDDVLVEEQLEEIIHYIEFMKQKKPK
ncbi:helix-turn-helix domain-containing protein [Enterococcus sp. AZ109]|uniref:helix-turn-helix domain-containing protein n=1 Tax=Enterococcus sp. AZ109 TaxID=2774634 RepID=UPI003F246521